ncbi:hypothetical protein [Kineosporia sp. NBRC 101731]|uniref:hypothetical protein n=1 Tax=Kineosporia sp. NBRC 101731 TaxID=3032199 RepID=UPI002554AE58|nr:hypothetical protein [Kineosporia sp. NBRC 101731]
MLVIVQTLTLLATNNVLGVLADAVAPTPVTVLAASLLLLSGLLALSSRPFRQV